MKFVVPQNCLKLSTYEFQVRFRYFDWVYDKAREMGVSFSSPSESKIETKENRINNEVRMLAICLNEFDRYLRERLRSDLCGLARQVLKLSHYGLTESNTKKSVFFSLIKRNNLVFE